MSQRRKFMQQLGLLTLALPSLGIKEAQAQQSSASSSQAGFTIAPYLQGLNADSVTIQTITNTKSYTWLEYGVGRIDRKHVESKHGLQRANTRYFSFTLGQLTPNTRYSYRIHTKNIVKIAGYDVQYGAEEVSPEYSFTTAASAAAQTQVTIFNDIHDRKESFEALWNVRQQKNTDLVVFNGDIFNQLYHADQLTENFFRPINALFSTSVPLVMNRGNHETRGAYAREFTDHFHYPGGQTYQAFQQGPIFWIFIDTGEDKPDSSEEYFGLVDFDRLRIEQRDWLLELVQTKAFKQAKFRAVAMHIPPLHSGDWHGPRHCTELFLPILNAHKIDLVCSGHTHQAKFHPPTAQQKFALLIGGAPQDGKRTIIDIQADQKTLTAKLIRDDNSVLATWSTKS